MAGEPPEIYPFLGGYLLAQAIDESGADLAVHGHAHSGTERGVTGGGVRVRNVAQPLLRRAFGLYRLHHLHAQAHPDHQIDAEAQRAQRAQRAQKAPEPRVNARSSGCPGAMSDRGQVRIAMGLTSGIAALGGHHPTDRHPFARA